MGIRKTDASSFLLPQRRAKRPLRNCRSSLAGGAKVGKNGSLVIT